MKCCNTLAGTLAEVQWSVFFVLWQCQTVLTNLQPIVFATKQPPFTYSHIWYSPNTMYSTNRELCSHGMLDSPIQSKSLHDHLLELSHHTQHTLCSHCTTTSPPALSTSPVVPHTPGALLLFNLLMHSRTSSTLISSLHSATCMVCILVPWPGRVVL